MTEQEMDNFFAKSDFSEEQKDLLKGLIRDTGFNQTQVEMIIGIATIIAMGISKSGDDELLHLIQNPSLMRI